MMPIGHQMAIEIFLLQVNLGHETGPSAILCIQWQPKATETSLGPILGLWACVGPL
jgi:hypothetical protein